MGKSGEGIAHIVPPVVVRGNVCAHVTHFTASTVLPANFVTVTPALITEDPMPFPSPFLPPVGDSMDIGLKEEIAKNRQRGLKKISLSTKISSNRVNLLHN